MTKFALKRQIGIIAAGLMAINASAIDKEPYRLDVEFPTALSLCSLTSKI